MTEPNVPSPAPVIPPEIEHAVAVLRVEAVDLGYSIAALPTKVDRNRALVTDATNALRAAIQAYVEAERRNTVSDNELRPKPTMNVDLGGYPLKQPIETLPSPAPMMPPELDVAMAAVVQAAYALGDSDAHGVDRHHMDKRTRLLAAQTAMVAAIQAYVEAQTAALWREREEMLAAVTDDPLPNGTQRDRQPLSILRSVLTDFRACLGDEYGTIHHPDPSAAYFCLGEAEVTLTKLETAVDHAMHLHPEST